MNQAQGQRPKEKGRSLESRDRGVDLGPLTCELQLWIAMRMAILGAGGMLDVLARMVAAPAVDALPPLAICHWSLVIACG